MESQKKRLIEMVLLTTIKILFGLPKNVIDLCDLGSDVSWLLKMLKVPILNCTKCTLNFKDICG